MVSLLFVGALLIAFIVDSVSAAGDSSNSFDIAYLYPLGLALFIAGLMWKFFIPITGVQETPPLSFTTGSFMVNFSILLDFVGGCDRHTKQKH